MLGGDLVQFGQGFDLNRGGAGVCCLLLCVFFGFMVFEGLLMVFELFLRVYVMFCFNENRVNLL